MVNRSRQDGEVPDPGEERPSLKRIEFLVLLVLADGDSHGYRIVKEIVERTGGQVRLLPGNLYAVLQRLTRRGLIAEAPRRESPDRSGQKRRYYGITAHGRQVLSSEAALWRSLIQAAEARNLIPGETSG